MTGRSPANDYPSVLPVKYVEIHFTESQQKTGLHEVSRRGRGALENALHNG